MTRLKKTCHTLLHSSLFIPTLFFLYHYKLWTGAQTLAADTGDGIGAFKFFSLPLRYWNWYESAGQAYWTEMAIYRLQDPLMWPILFFLKALPVGPLIQFNLYILFRICLLGIGTFYLLKTLKCKTFSAQVGTAIALFGSAFPVMFRSIGALDTITAFAGLTVFTLKFTETKRKAYLYLTGLVFLHASITYHILYLVPVMALLLIFGFKFLRSNWTELILYKKEAVFIFIAVTFAFSAEYLAVKDPLLLPALRSMRYNTWVDGDGKVTAKEWGVGESVLNNRALTADSSDCGTRFSCRAYSTEFLKTFILLGSAWSLTGYVSFLGLFTLLFSLLLMRNRIILALQLSAFMCFVLSLGGQTPIWPIVQTVIPVLQFVRHTGFYFHLFVYILCLLIGLTLSRFEVHLRRPLKLLVAIILFVDLFAFNRLYVSGFLNFIKDGQLTRIATQMPLSFTSRALRIYNPYLIPRSSASTTYGEPSALESIFVQDTITDDHLARGESPRHFGFITLFMSQPMVKARVRQGGDVGLFKETAGVAPYSVMSPALRRNFGFAVTMAGENLVSRFKMDQSGSLYLAAPFAVVDKILLNGIAVPFSMSRNGFGVIFASGSGDNSVEIVPKLGRRNLIYTLYYGAYLTLFYLVFQPVKFLSRIFRDTSFNLSDLLSRTMVSKRFFT